MVMGSARETRRGKWNKSEKGMPMGVIKEDEGKGITLNIGNRSSYKRQRRTFMEVKQGWWRRKEKCPPRKRNLPLAL